MTVSVTLPQVRDWIQTPASVLSDEQLQLLLDGEMAHQAWQCRIDPLVDQPTLDEALLRRVARAAAAKGIPLGVLGADAEGGAAMLPSYDAEISRLEAPVRKFVFG
jgi:hypothetical protein